MSFKKDNTLEIMEFNFRNFQLNECFEGINFRNFYIKSNEENVGKIKNCMKNYNVLFKIVLETESDLPLMNKREN